MGIRKLLMNSFVVYLAIELAEEFLEELIVIGISSIFIKGLSAIFVVTLSQLFKTLIKTIIKKFTYKEGSDKMDKLRTISKWLFANKKTLCGTLSVALLSVSGVGLIDVNGLPELLIGGYNITPILYYLLVSVFALIGVYGKGLEKIEEFFHRIGILKAERQEKKIQKEALKEIKAEEKLANQTEAEQKKAQAKAEIEEQLKAKKQQAEEEHKQKIEEAKAKILAERNNQPTEVE